LSLLNTPVCLYIFLITIKNKVYGDAPNEIQLEEQEFRWDYADPVYEKGIPHSLFGASKVAADVMVQEYGRYFGCRPALFDRACSFWCRIAWFDVSTLYRTHVYTVLY
jgi:hypothetical protein